MASFRNVLRGVGTRNRYEAVQGKENQGYLETPRSKTTNMAKTPKSQESEKTRSQSNFRRNSSVTQSVRDVVGTLRQVLFNVYYQLNCCLKQTHRPNIYSTCMPLMS